MSETTIRQLTPEDIPAAMELVLAVRWNQIEQDWRNVMAMEPAGCLALECDGRLVSTATTVCYGKTLAWIGMVLTDPAYRGRGFARRLMLRCLDFCEARGVALVKLDATDMGAPLYRSLGFEDEQAVERWRREPGATVDGSAGAYVEDLALDSRAFGADRATLLGMLSGIEAASIPGAGFAMGRPGRMTAYFGPCVCASAAAAEALLRWFLARHPHEAVVWDLIADNAEAVGLARKYGFTAQRHLIRQARGAGVIANDDGLVFGLAGFEYG